MSRDAKLNCRRCTGTDVVNIQGYVLCRHAKVTSRCRVMEHLRHTLPDASDCGATLPAIQGDTLSSRNKVCLGRHTWGAIPVWGLGSPCRCAQLSQHLSLSGTVLQYHVPAVGPSYSGHLALRYFVVNPFENCHVWLSLSIYEVKYTTLNPIQLPTTPSAEYALVNINGKNS